MGEKSQEALKLQFDKRLRLEFHGARVTSDAGLLACLELAGTLGLTEVAPTYFREARGGRNVQYERVPMLRQSVYSRYDKLCAQADEGVSVVRSSPER
jgi:hypothetical protein